VQSGQDPRAIMARIDAFTDGDPEPSTLREVALNPSGEIWSGKVTGLPSGRYRVSIHPANPAAGPVDPVADIFEIA
jgi:hypothetical protein